MWKMYFCYSFVTSWWHTVWEVFPHVGVSKTSLLLRHLNRVMELHLVLHFYVICLGTTPTLFSQAGLVSEQQATPFFGFTQWNGAAFKSTERPQMCGVFLLQVKEKAQMETKSCALLLQQKYQTTGRNSPELGNCSAPLILCPVVE